MKLITRYLLKELASPFLIGVVLFTFILLFGQFMELTDLVVNQGVSIFNLVTFVLLGIPETFTLIVPMAMVLATLMAYGRLAADNELVVLRAAGVPMYSLIIPTLVTGLVLSVLLVGFTEYVAPTLSSYRAQKMAEMKQPNPMGLMQPRTYKELGPFVVYAERIDGRRMEGVYIRDNRGPGSREIWSETGRWARTNGRYELVLQDGEVHEPGASAEEYRVMNFQSQTIQFQPDQTRSPSGDEQVRSLGERWDQYRNAYEKYNQLRGRRSEPDGNRPADNVVNRARTMYVKAGLNFHRAVAFPFACFFLVLIAAPIGMLAQQEGKSMGFAASIGIIFAYYIMMLLAEPLALNHWVGPATAMWSGNVTFGAVGMALMAWLYSSH
jgi:LPS export ABC transporter permease LptF